MKTICNYSLTGITLVFGLLFLTYSSCKGPEPVVEPTPVEVTTALLIGPAWVVQSVKVDDVALDLYKSLNVSFTADGKYTSVNGGAIWSASGTWKFKDETAKVMIREDGLEIAIDAITEKAMTISFTRTGDIVYEVGRNEAVSGKHVFTFGR